MKNACLFFLVVVFIVKTIEAEKIPGYYITKSNDTVKVIFKIPVGIFSQMPDYERLQWKTKYLDSNKRKHKLKPKMVKEIGFECGGRDHIMLSCPNNLKYLGPLFSDNRHIFLHVLINGKLKLLKFYQTNSVGVGTAAASGMMMNSFTYTVEKLILQKDNGLLFRPRRLSFKKRMTNYLSDCPTLAQKIENKELRRRNIREIVLLYNQNCN